MRIKYIFFDWAGTLGISGCRIYMIHGRNKREREKALNPATREVLRTLKQRGYVLGVLSNTKYSPYHMKKGLKRMGLSKYFTYQIYNSEPGMCSKACVPIFKKAIRLTGAKPDEILYVGNNYLKDVVTPARLGMKTAYIKTKKDWDMVPINKRGKQTYTLRNLRGLTTNGI